MQSIPGQSTILVSIKINNGVVMAADSASSFASGMVYQHADKIVNLRQGLPIGAMVTGAGGIGKRINRHAPQGFASPL